MQISVPVILLPKIRTRFVFYWSRFSSSILGLGLPLYELLKIALVLVNENGEPYIVIFLAHS